MADTSVIDIRDDTVNPDPRGNLTNTTPLSSDSVLPQNNFLQDAGYDPAKSAEVSHQLAGIEQKKLDTTTWADRQSEGRLEQDRSRMDHAYRLEAASAEDPALRPWNAEQARSSMIRGPLEQFGSIGSIFAMAASAFTRQPMVSALNAGAAAMTAIHQSDEEAYKSAYQAWKDNSNLALKRFDMERTLYEDANKLATTDMSLWQQKRLSIAAQFDDQKTIALLQNGMAPEVLKIDAERLGMAEKLRKAVEGNEETEFKRQTYADQVKAWKAEHPGNEKDPNWLREFTIAKLHAWHDSLGATKPGAQYGRASADQEFIQRYYAEHPEATPEEFSNAFGEFKRGQRAPGSAGAAGTAPRPGSVNDDRVKMDADIRKEHPDWSDAKVIEERNKRLKSSTTSLTGNEKEKLETRINKFARSDEIIDKTLKVLETHSGAAGIAGKVMRLEERVGNILGAKSTDRVQMMRDVELLRGWAKELLFSSNSKLKKEAERVDSIVAGTSAGDTGPNTIRALRDLKNMYDQMRVEDEAKLGGTWKSPVAGESKPAPTSGKTPWSKDPIVSP